MPFVFWKAHSLGETCVHMKEHDAGYMEATDKKIYKTELDVWFNLFDCSDTENTLPIQCKCLWARQWLTGNKSFITAWNKGCSIYSTFIHLQVKR